MSRSRKKYPIGSITCRGTNISGLEKFYKNLTNRKIRYTSKDPLVSNVFLRNKNNFSNIWRYPKDGKSWWENPKAYRK